MTQIRQIDYFLSQLQHQIRGIPWAPARRRLPQLPSHEMYCDGSTIKRTIFGGKIVGAIRNDVRYQHRYIHILTKKTA